jgi:membrane protease subunit (stomatin/prohibitin family)
MAVLDLVQLPNQAPDEVVHRIPESGSGEFRLGSQLVVREDQRAIFMRDGKALDVFGPGRHTLSTNNLPMLGGLIGSLFGGRSPFTAEVYFVSMREFTGMKWGTVQPMTYRDSDFGMVRLRAFGGYSMKVSDPQLLVGTLAGSRGIYSIADLDDYLKNIIVNAFNDLLGDTHKSLLDLPGMTSELAAGMQAGLADQFRRLGLQLLTFQIGAITPPDEVQKRIDERSSMGAIGNMQTYMQYQTAQAIGEAASNPGTGGDMAATGVGLGAGVGLGSAMAQSMRDAMNPQQQQQPQQAAPKAAPAAATMTCPACGKTIPADSKFCPECGAKIEAPAVVYCPECGTANTAGSKFCTNCGHKLTT